MQLILVNDKETKGSIRWNDNKGHNLYFTKEEIAQAFGNNIPKTIVITVEPQVIAPAPAAVDAAPVITPQ